MSLLICGASILNGIADDPVNGHAIWIEGKRIKAVARREEFGVAPAAKIIDAAGKFVIPGLMNANVHLLGDVRLESLVRHMDGFELLIAEAAQVALRNGLTTVFDTWGPRRHLMAVRDKISTGELQGSRIFCAGNIVGFDGPLSHDFDAKAAEVASTALIERVNEIWVENVGRHLMWLSPEQVASEIRAYIGKGVDFIKYASNEHFGNSGGAFLAFSPDVQRVIVDEAHRAGLSAQAHTMSVEGLRVAVEAGCDLIQHANITGPVPIPENTLDLLARRRTGAVVFPLTQRRLDWVMENAPPDKRTMWEASSSNIANLIQCGALILLANDGFLMAEEARTDPKWGSSKVSLAPGEDNLYDLAGGHFAWFKAMDEQKLDPMKMLKAATINIATAYGRQRDLGSVEPGKLADLVLLDKDPLQAAENCRGIHMVIKDGAVIDRSALPSSPVLTGRAGLRASCPDISLLATRGMCPMCICH